MLSSLAHSLDYNVEELIPVGGVKPGELHGKPPHMLKQHSLQAI